MSLLSCFDVVCKLNNVITSKEQLCHELAVTEADFGINHLLLASKRLKLKAKSIQTTVKRLPKLNLPAIGFDKSGNAFVIAQRRSEELLIHYIGQAPKVMSFDDFDGIWTGQVLLFTTRASLASLGKKFDISWFIPVIVKYKKHLIEVLIASFFIQVIALITPLFFQVVIDKVMGHQAYTTLTVLAVGLLIVSFFDVLINGLRTYLFSHTTNRMDVTLGAKLYEHLVSLPLGYFQSRQVGTTIARVRELDSLREFITGSGLTLIVDICFTFIFFAVLYYYSPLLTAVVALSIPFYILLSVFVTPILRARLDELFKRGAQNQAFLVESVTGVETMKALALEPQMKNKWNELLAGYVTSSFRAKNLGNIAGQIAAFIDKVVVVLILWIGATLVMKGELSVGQLIAFNMIAGRISGPILRLVQLWQDFQQAQISIKRLGDILNSPKEPGTSAGKIALPAVKGEVVFDQVMFRYDPQAALVLNNISLSVKPGEVIGIVGRSGSGKSTLTKLVQRLYIPESGRIMIDGIDMAQIDPAWLRRQIGVVLQENFLFNKTVRENIALAEPATEMDKIVEAAKLAGAHEFILQLAQGYDTVIEERGSNLSGGQRQRLAIARALVMEPAVLIFDEATSALDYESESIIQENMKDICAGRTVFIIAHRLSAVKDANRIVVFDKGYINEQGSHDELIDFDGIYAKLWNMQTMMTQDKGDQHV